MKNVKHSPMPVQLSRPEEVSRQNWTAIAALAKNIRGLGVDDATEKKLTEVEAKAERALATERRLSTIDELYETNGRLRAENERLRRFVRSLAESPATALDGHMVVAAAATVLGSESESPATTEKQRP